MIANFLLSVDVAVVVVVLVMQLNSHMDAIFNVKQHKVADIHINFVQKLYCPEISYVVRINSHYRFQNPPG